MTKTQRIIIHYTGCAVLPVIMAAGFDIFLNNIIWWGVLLPYATIGAFWIANGK